MSETDENSSKPMPTGNPGSRAARRQLADMLQNLRPGDVDHTAEFGEAKLTRRLSWRTTLVLVLLFVPAGWAAALWANQVALHRRVARDVHQLAERVERHRGETGLYPDAATWQRWVSGSDAASLLDPWGRPYSYTVDSRAFSIATQGADGLPGGSWNDEDLTFVFRYTNRRMALPQAQSNGRTADQK